MEQDQAAAAGASLLDLPDDILVHTLQLVGFASAWAARRACRRLRDAVERGVRAGELRAAADDPAALELLAALVRAGRVRADAVSITLEQGRRRATRDALLRLFRAAAAVVEACAASATAAESFEATLTLKDNVLTVDLFEEALRGSPEFGRLTGLHLPLKLEVHEGTAEDIAARCPRLRRLGFALSWRWSSWFGGRIFGQLAALPLEELAVACRTDRQAGHLQALVGTPAGASLRLLDLGDEVWLDDETRGALLSFPCLERVASKLVVPPHTVEALLEGIAGHGALREVRLVLRSPDPSFVQFFGEALPRSRLTDLHLELDLTLLLHLAIGDIHYRLCSLVPLFEGARAALRSLRLALGRPLSPAELAALAACGPRLEAVCLSVPPEEEGDEGGEAGEEGGDGEARKARPRPPPPAPPRPAPPRPVLTLGSAQATRPLAPPGRGSHRRGPPRRPALSPLEELQRALPAARLELLRAKPRAARFCQLLLPADAFEDPFVQ
eukprot:tig00020563_g11367.t1